MHFLCYRMLTLKESKSSVLAHFLRYRTLTLIESKSLVLVHFLFTER